MPGHYLPANSLYCRCLGVYLFLLLMESSSENYKKNNYQ